jgi:hypothetical protein
MVEGFALFRVDFEPEKDAVDLVLPLRKIQQVRNTPSLRGWPRAAAITRILPIWRLYPKPRPVLSPTSTMKGKVAGQVDHPYDLLINVTARNEEELKKAFAVIGRHCHVEGYGA